MSLQYEAHASLGREIFGAAELGDRRRTARLVKTFDRMCAHPGGTLCRIEDMQFTTTDRLEPAIALLSVVAVTLLNLREASRRPDADTRRADTLLSPEYIEVLSLKRYGAIRDDLTVREFFLALARLGGHQNRKCDGHPGWLVLWRGWMKLQAMLDGYRAAQRKKCGKT